MGERTSTECEPKGLDGRLPTVDDHAGQPAPDVQPRRQPSRIRVLRAAQLLMIVVACLCGALIVTQSGRAIRAAQERVTSEQQVHTELLGIRENLGRARTMALRIRAGELTTFDPVLAAKAGVAIVSLSRLAGRLASEDAELAARARTALSEYTELAGIYARYLQVPIGAAEGRRLARLAQPKADGLADVLDQWIAREADEVTTLTAAMRTGSLRIVTVMALLIAAIVAACAAAWVLGSRRRSRVRSRIEQAARHDDGAALQDVLRQIAVSIARGDPESELTTLVAHNAAELTGATIAVISRFADGQITSVGSYGGPRALPAMPATDGDGALAQVARTGRPARVDRFIDLDSADPARIGALALGMRSGVAAPITTDDGLWGAILVLAPRNITITHRAEHRLVRLAELMAISIASARERKRLEQAAMTDSLTGLANHRAFEGFLGDAIDTSRRNGTPLALALLDIDHFKHINDAHGHLAGDAVLIELARRLASQVRDGDFVARTGGEEFAIIVSNAVGTDAVSVVDRIRRAAFEAPFSGVGRLTASAGVSDLDPQADDPIEFRRRTDKALYWSKETGRDQTSHFQHDVTDAHSQVSGARQLERASRLTTLAALARAVDAKDSFTSRHSVRVSDLAVAIAHELDWERGQIECLREAAILHDVGKIGVPDAVLLKPGQLTEEEFREIERHPGIGAEIARDVLSQEQVSWIRHHHERIDGSGYPDRIAGDRIPDGARILAAADGWDAMTGARQYRDGLTPEEALQELRRCAGTQWCPTVVDALIRVLSRRDVRSDVADVVSTKLLVTLAD